MRQNNLETQATELRVNPIILLILDITPKISMVQGEEGRRPKSEQIP